MSKDLFEQFRAIIWADDLARSSLEAAARAGLPPYRVVSGVLYNAVWNHLTGRASGFGVKDVDIAYFDDSDLSYDAEDKVIKAAMPWFSAVDKPVEIRNQARVHLWYESHFGEPYSPLRSVEEGIDRYACETHAVGARLTEAGELEIYAPFGLEDIFAMRLIPNRVLNNRETHERKARRQLEYWPELTVAPW